MIEIPLWLVALVGLLLVAGSLAVLLMQRQKKPKPPELPKEWALTARAVFTTGERRVYRMLKETLPNHVILSKLPLVRFCQPIDLGQLRYWYDMLGTNYVSFAICAPNGRVLAAIDIDKDRSTDANPHLRRSMKIKRSVLRSCRVRYLRTPVGKLPSAAEIHALLPKAGVAPAGAPTTATAATAAENSPAAQKLAAAAREAAAQAAVHFAVSQVEPRATGSAGRLATPLHKPPQPVPDALWSGEAAQQPAAPIPAAPTLFDAVDLSIDEVQAAAPTEAVAEPVRVDPAAPQAPPPTQAADPEPEPLQAEASTPATAEAADSSAFDDSEPVPAAAASEDGSGPSDREALSRAREALAHTVASRRAQRNILWQESSVFQDSFFALDSRLGEFGNDEPSTTMSGDLDLDSGPLPLQGDFHAPRTGEGNHEGDKPTVVRVTLDDMVPSERLSKVVTDDVEEARYASAGRP